jgi:hypothetical protein
MRRLLILAMILLPGLPLTAAAQAKGTISPGMSRAKVVAALGAPATERSAAEFTYLFYRNSCGRQCGMNDLVILQRDSVIDAIFRSPNRHYTGTSSSPAPIAARDAARAGATPSSTSPASGTRMKPPATANDARPSIPTNPPVLRPSTSTSPAPRTP